MASGSVKNWPRPKFVNRWARSQPLTYVNEEAYKVHGGAPEVDVGVTIHVAVRTDTNDHLQRWPLVLSVARSVVEPIVRAEVEDSVVRTTRGRANLHGSLVVESKKLRDDERACFEEDAIMRR